MPKSIAIQVSEIVAQHITVLEKYNNKYVQNRTLKFVIPINTSAGTVTKIKNSLAKAGINVLSVETKLSPKMHMFRASRALYVRIPL